MSTNVLYRMAAVLLLVFALGHQFGFRSVDPAWQAEGVVRAMQSTQFPVQGFTRTYWQFYSGFGFFVTVFLLFSAVFTWMLGRLAEEPIHALTPTLWAFAACYWTIALLAWSNFFLAPGVFATLIAACLTIAAFQAQRAQSTTKTTIQAYFDRLERRDGWDSAMADDVVFTSFTSPPREVSGREPFLQSTRRFYSSIADVKVRDVLVDGDRACVLTRYRLQPPNGAPPFESDVAEIFTVKNKKIGSFGIYFDSAPFPR